MSLILKKTKDARNPYDRSEVVLTIDEPAELSKEELLEEIKTFLQAAGLDLDIEQLSGGILCQNKKTNC